MNLKKIHKVNENFFKIWSPNMAYVLGYFIADGCITVSKERKSNPYTFNITSVDKEHLEKIKKALKSTHKISRKNGKSQGDAYQIQIRNNVLAEDLIQLGIKPRKTYNLSPVRVPKKYFSDYVRGLFDGDGTVYIYTVNKVQQVKVELLSTSLSYIKHLNEEICSRLKIPTKNIHTERPKGIKKLDMYSICFYVEDSQKFSDFIYDNNPKLFLERKRSVFEEWEKIGKSRRQYNKQSYPSKVGWQLRKKAVVS